MRPTPDNPRGYSESSKVYVLHRHILESAGTTWDDWVSISDDWFKSLVIPDFKARALEVLEEEFGTSPLFAFKDPRLCRLMPFWRDVLEEAECNPLVVHTHRNPLEVARSINVRDGHPMEVALLMWLQNVLDAERYTRDMVRAFTSYTRLLKDPPGELRKLQTSLDVTFPKLNDRTQHRIRSRIEPDLRHHSVEAEDLKADVRVSPWILDTFEILDRWAEGGEDASDHASLDAIRGQVATAAPTLFALTDKTQALQSDVDTLSTRISGIGASPGSVADAGAQPKGTRRPDLDAALRKVEDALLTSDEALKEKDAALHTAESALRQREAEVDAVRKELSSLREVVEAKTLRVAEADGEIKSLGDQLTVEKASLATRYQELAALTSTLVAKEAEFERQTLKATKLKAEITDIEAAKTRADAATEEAEQRARWAYEEVHMLRQSTSWRLTSPIRRFGGLLKRSARTVKDR